MRPEPFTEEHLSDTPPTPLLGRLLALSANVRQGCKGLPGTNTSLLRKDVNYGSKKFYNIDTRGGMTEQYYYERTETYEKILNRKKDFVGCHSVPMVHSSVLVNLRRRESVHLTYLPDKVLKL